jgi:hypothetical protein
MTDMQDEYPYEYRVNIGPFRRAEKNQSGSIAYFNSQKQNAVLFGN